MSRTTITNLQTRQTVIYGRGAPGPPGPSGGAGVTYTHTQSSASDTWTINHNLGFRPSVELLSAGGVEMEGEVVHTSINQVIVSFVTPLAGSARLN